jgi:hypothetical protein
MPVATIDLAQLEMMITPTILTTGMDVPIYSLWRDRASGALFVAQQGGFSGSWTWFGPTTREETAVQHLLAVEEEMRGR